MPEREIMTAWADTSRSTPQPNRSRADSPKCDPALSANSTLRCHRASSGEPPPSNHRSFFTSPGATVSFFGHGYLLLAPSTSKVFLADSCTDSAPADAMG